MGTEPPPASPPITAPAPTGLDVFADLVRQHQSGLRGFIRTLGVESARVDDIAQEAFVVAYRRYQTFDSQKDFGRWDRSTASW